MVELFNLYSFSIVLFSIAYGSLILFISYQVISREKVARPFLFSMLIYFALDLVGIIFLYLYNFHTEFGTKLDLSQERDLLLVGLQLCALLLFMVSPSYLIYNLEALVFKKKAIKEKHVFTIIQIIFVGIMILAIILYPNFILAALMYVSVSLIQVIFFFAGFLYLTIKSTGKLRINSFLVLLGYIWQFVVNTIYLFVIISFHEVNEAFFNLIGIIVMFRLAGLLVMAYGLLILYTFSK